MKKLFTLAVLMIGALTFLGAQKFPGLDKSPMDASQWRADRSAPVQAEVIYSRPMKNDRDIWGSLIPFGKMWRLGANEATEITFMNDVNFGGTPVSAGTYSMYLIPEKDGGKVILNKKINTWGAYQYDASMDIAKVDALVGENDAPVEAFSIIFENQDDGSTHLVMGWDNMHYRVPVK